MILRCIWTSLLAFAMSKLQNPNRSWSLHASAPMIVVFGRPGAGKTTVAEKSIAKLLQQQQKQQEQEEEEKAEENRKLQCLGLDLDVCVPQWMKDNFAKGVYPTLQQRHEFALNACSYVEEQITKTKDGQLDKSVIVASIISFSFVNTDLRETFRRRFPHALWVLIDTNDIEATKRINERQDHFYKGNTKQNKQRDDNDDTSSSRQAEAVEGSGITDGSRSSSSSSSSSSDDDKDDADPNNSDWKFAPVTFPHVILDGMDSVDENADNVLKVLFDAI